MMDSTSMGSDRQGRKRFGRPGTAAAADNRSSMVGRRRKRRKKARAGGGGGNGRGHQERLAELEPVRDSSSVLGNRVPQKRRREELAEGPPDAFALFCAYHLGVTAEDGYQRPSLSETARRYGVAPEEIQSMLAQYEIDQETVAKTDFDLEGARLDIRVAPEGISRTELAREHYENYLECLSSLA